MERNQKTIVNVRTCAEFGNGHVPGSINIPLPELLVRMNEIRALAQPVVLCCASGVRSLKAAGQLTQEGILCENGGSWLNLINTGK